MGIFDFIGGSKRKLEEKIEYLEKQLLPEQKEIMKLSEEIQKLNSEIDLKSKEIISKDAEYNNILVEIARVEASLLEKRKELIILDDEILFQDFGLYQPIYDFYNSEQYKSRLESVRERQKNMIKNKKACNFFDNWTVNGSVAKGRKMTNDNIKQILRLFNTECENAIDRVKFSNVESMRKRIVKSYEQLNKMNETNKVSIVPLYLDLKLDELDLAYEYALKKQEEKEEAKAIREQLREQAKLEKELAEARKSIEKEKKHYSNVLSSLLKQLELESDNEELLSKKQELESKLGEIGTSLEQLDYREANKKAGYVYVISNIGSFGKDVYKIGMTRRLDPMDRVSELGDASVPFNFDVHAIIFSDDAPKLESALHRAFEKKQVNIVNKRREFFHVTLDEIEDVVKENFDKTIEFNRIADAEQYRESEQMRKNMFLNTL